MGSSICAGTMTSYYVSHANVIAHESEWQGAALLREKCGRAGQYRKQNLIARYGADIRLPDLREKIPSARVTVRCMTQPIWTWG